VRIVRIRAPSIRGRDRERERERERERRKEEKEGRREGRGELSQIVNYPREKAAGVPPRGIYAARRF